MQGSHILQYLTSVAEYCENNEFYWPSQCDRMQVLLWLTSAETIYEAEALMIEALRLLYKCRVERILVGKTLVRIDFWEWVTDKTRDFLARRGWHEEVHLWMLQRKVWKEQGTLEYLIPRGHLVLKHLKSQNKFLDYKNAYPQLFDKHNFVHTIEISL
jgi:hypothetical protein